MSYLDQSYVPQSMRHRTHLPEKCLIRFYSQVTAEEQEEQINAANKRLEDRGATVKNTRIQVWKGAGQKKMDFWFCIQYFGGNSD